MSFLLRFVKLFKVPYESRHMCYQYRWGYHKGYQYPLVVIGYAIKALIYNVACAICIMLIYKELIPRSNRIVKKNINYEIKARNIISQNICLQNRYAQVYLLISHILSNGRYVYKFPQSVICHINPSVEACYIPPHLYQHNIFDYRSPCSRSIAQQSDCFKLPT